MTLVGIIPLRLPLDDDADETGEDPSWTSQQRSAVTTYCQQKLPRREDYGGASIRKMRRAAIYEGMFFFRIDNSINHGVFQKGVMQLSPLLYKSVLIIHNNKKVSGFFLLLSFNGSTQY